MRTWRWSARRTRFCGMCVDLGGPAMARIAKDYGYTLAELCKL
jgi:hypothetical protein